MTEASAPSTTTVVMRSYDLLTDEWQPWPALKEQGANYDHLSELHFHWHMVDCHQVTVGCYYAVLGGRRNLESTYTYFRRGSGDEIYEYLAYYV